MKSADVETLFKRLKKQLPEPTTELAYNSPFELLIAVILSAQCTDKRVNLLTPSFFAQFPDVFALAEGTREQVFDLIKSCSYPNNKSKHLLGMAKKLVDRFGGSVPDTMEELQELPGVGRKTANVILNTAFGEPTIAVDTHIFRVANRTGLAPGKTPLEVEKRLTRLTPEEFMKDAHHWLILHGRYVCKARKPLCGECAIIEWCEYRRKELP